MTFALAIVLTSLLTCALTIIAAWVAFVRYLEPRLWADIDKKVDELGHLIRKRTRQGVREGIAESFEEMRKRATRSATQAPLDMLEESLNLWFGKRQSPD